jgi:hypothetical protein
MLAMVGDVSVLLVNVSVVARPTSVSVDDGKVSVPVLLIDEMIGNVSVLLVSVSLVVRPTSVSVDVGNVSVPVLTMLAIMGAVNVLLVNVSVVARPTIVSVVVGNVSTAAPLTIEPPDIVDVTSDHEAAVVPLVDTHVTTVLSDGVTVVTRLPPDEFTVTEPVDRLVI